MITSRTRDCRECTTELAVDALVCPACRTLVYAETLRQLADSADTATQSGEFLHARGQWESALELLPPQAAQRAVIAQRIAGLTRRIDVTSSATDTNRSRDEAFGWRRAGAGVLAVGLLLLGKLKFIALGLTKASTFFSMFAFFGLYWSIYGWPLALGLLLSIYVHEMGHVAMLRRLGIGAGAPLFIPGVGAFVMLKQEVRDPLTNARIGLAGPVWGLGAAVFSAAVYWFTGVPVWLAIAELTAVINLFNLIPIWQLDGARGLHVLARHERWMLIAAVALTLAATGQGMLWIVGAVTVWQVLRQESGPGDSRTFATFVGLVLALAWLARGIQ